MRLTQRFMVQMGAVFLASFSVKVVEVDGFVNLPHQSAGQYIVRHGSTSLSTSSSILRSERGVYEINRAMDDLAEQCGDVKKPVVALASQVEDIYKQAKQKDIISFNVMLKAWGKACQSMEKQKHAHNNGQKVTIHRAPSMAIYTPRDAAEHLTKHLLTAEEACQGDGDNCVVVPDETSYNIAIGETILHTSAVELLFYHTNQQQLTHSSSPLPQMPGPKVPSPIPLKSLNGC